MFIGTAQEMGLTIGEHLTHLISAKPQIASKAATTRATHGRKSNAVQFEPSIPHKSSNRA